MNNTHDNRQLCQIWSDDEHIFHLGIESVKDVIIIFFKLIQMKYDYHRFRKHPSIKNRQKLVKILNSVK